MKTIPAQSLKSLTPSAALDFFKSGGRIQEGPPHDPAVSAKDLAWRLIARTADIKRAAHVATRGYAMSVPDTVKLLRVRINSGGTLEKPSDSELTAIAEAAARDTSKPEGFMLPSGQGKVASVADLPGPPTEKARQAAQDELMALMRECDSLTSGTAKGAWWQINKDRVAALSEIETLRGSTWQGAFLQLIPAGNRAASTFAPLPEEYRDYYRNKQSG